MADIKWIKLSTSMFDDEKIRLIEQMPDADTILVIWIKLLSQAGKTNASGYIYLSQNIPYTEEMLATIFNRPISTIRLALKTFENLGMIEVDDEHFIQISNWSKHQSVDKLAKIKEQNRLRQQRYRDKKQLENKSNVNVTLRNATEEELEEELDIDKEDKEIPSQISKVQEIYNHYLSKNIVQHQKITSAMRTAINARLRDYSYEQIIQAVDNYATVYHGNEYWFDTKYTLTDLMRDKDVRKFIDDADPLKNFLKGGSDNGANRHRNGNAGSYGKGTSYEQAIRAAERSRKAYNR